MRTTPGEVSALLGDLQEGDQAAATRLLPIVYGELRRLAAHYMRGEKSGQTIQATELVHEAYLRLVGQECIEWHGRSHFIAMAATSMRRILVDHARRKMAEKHGGGRKKSNWKKLSSCLRKSQTTCCPGWRAQAARRDIAKAESRCRTTVLRRP
jgi:RNA polymerase sigma factor (TIGR02999 family)